MSRTHLEERGRTTPASAACGKANNHRRSTQVNSCELRVPPQTRHPLPNGLLLNPSFSLSPTRSLSSISRGHGRQRQRLTPSRNLPVLSCGRPISLPLSLVPLPSLASRLPLPHLPLHRPTSKFRQEATRFPLRGSEEMQLVLFPSPLSLSPIVPSPYRSHSFLAANSRFSIASLLASRHSLALSPVRQPHWRCSRPFHLSGIPFVFHFGPISPIARGTRSPGRVHDSEFDPSLEYQFLISATYRQN